MKKNQWLNSPGLSLQATPPVYILASLFFLLVACASTSRINPPDSTAPTITLVPSTQSVTQSSTVTFEIAATDNQAISKVELLEGSNLLNSSLSSSLNHTIQYLPIDDGVHVYTARATDSSGNQAQVGTTITVVIPNTSTDTTPPSNVGLTGSSSNLIAPATTILTANATDNIGVARIDLIENNQVIQSANSQPYQFTLNYTSANIGDHNYTARAFDAAGNSSNSSSLKISVGAPASGGVTYVGTAKDLFDYSLTQFNLEKPTQVLAGDLMLAFVIVNSDQNILSAPTGWTLFNQFPVFGGGPAIKGVYMYKHYATANEASSYGFSLPNAVAFRGVILAYRGANTVLETHSVNNTRDTPVIIPSLNTTISGCTLLRIGSAGPLNHERKLVSQGGLVPRYDTGLTLYFTFYIGEELQTTAGATGTRTLITQDDLNQHFDEGFSSFTLALCP
jgi:Bacterial Ig domain